MLSDVQMLRYASLVISTRERVHIFAQTKSATSNQLTDASPAEFEELSGSLMLPGGLVGLDITHVLDFCG